MDKIVIRAAQRKDCALILYFIEELAKYEKLSANVTADISRLEKNLFDKNYGQTLLIEYDRQPVGFALFFYNFSTFLAQPGIYLEDLFVLPEYRSYGLGKAVLSYLAKLAVAEDCGRLEFSCLDWNQSSIAFYQKLGAQAMSDWTLYRLEGNPLKKLAGE